MSWIERSVEERLAKAAEAGELRVPVLEGKPVDDLDHPRSQGWWAERFVQRELSHDRRQRAVAAAAAARTAFWRADTIDDLRSLVAAANAAIVRANINLITGDRLEPFDAVDIEERWRRLRSSR